MSVCWDVAARSYSPEVPFPNPLLSTDKRIPVFAIIYCCKIEIKLQDASPIVSVGNKPRLLRIRRYYPPPPGFRQDRHYRQLGKWKEDQAVLLTDSLSARKPVQQCAVRRRDSAVCASSSTDPGEERTGCRCCTEYSVKDLDKLQVILKNFIVSAYARWFAEMKQQ